MLYFYLSRYFRPIRPPSQNSVSAKHLGKKLTTVKFRIDMNVLKLHFIYKKQSHTNFFNICCNKTFYNYLSFLIHTIIFYMKNRAHIIKMMYALSLFIHILYFFFIFKYFLKLITTTLRK